MYFRVNCLQLLPKKINLKLKILLRVMSVSEKLPTIRTISGSLAWGIYEPWWYGKTIAVRKHVSVLHIHTPKGAFRFLFFILFYYFPWFRGFGKKFCLIDLTIKKNIMTAIWPNKLLIRHGNILWIFWFFSSIFIPNKKSDFTYADVVEDDKEKHKLCTLFELIMFDKLENVYCRRRRRLGEGGGITNFVPLRKWFCHFKCFFVEKRSITTPASWKFINNMKIYTGQWKMNYDELLNIQNDLAGRVHWTYMCTDRQPTYVRAVVELWSYYTHQRCLVKFCWNNFHKLTKMRFQFRLNM